MAIPTRYRERLASRCNGEIVVTVDKDHCLLVYPLPDWEELERKLVDGLGSFTHAVELQDLLSKLVEASLEGAKLAGGESDGHPTDLALRATPEVTSIQITFHEDRPPASHSMPPGGFRLAIVNTFDLELGRRIREDLALSFWTTQQLIRRGRRSSR